MSMHTLLQCTQSVFQQVFGYPASLDIQAPGRVNLIGEHTDYNDGFVLPCAIDYQTVISASPRQGSVVRVVAADYDNQQDSFDLKEEIVAHPDYLWANYVRGVVKQLLEAGHPLTGADLVQLRRRQRRHVHGLFELGQDQRCGEQHADGRHGRHHRQTT